jgi:hypothetical protein
LAVGSLATFDLATAPPSVSTTPNRAALLSQESSPPPSDVGSSSSSSSQVFLSRHHRPSLEGVPLSLQDSISLTNWWTFWCDLEPVLLKNERIDTYMRWGTLFFWVGYAAIAYLQPWPTFILTSESWHQVSLVSNIVLLLWGFRVVRVFVQGCRLLRQWLGVGCASRNGKCLWLRTRWSIGRVHGVSQGPDQQIMWRTVLLHIPLPW